MPAHTKYLLDTNILLYLTHKDAAFHDVTSGAVRTLEQVAELYVSPQNLIEFWRACTRPEANGGFNHSPQETAKRLDAIEARFLILPESPEIFTQWRALVLAHRVSGRQVHDARLAAVMIAGAIPAILTKNSSDFRRYAAIEAVDPEDIVKQTE
jgi:predicted nucleic acid-binding protein